jgi:hypothetical protein
MRQYQGGTAVGPAHYREMLNAAYSAAKAVNPRCAWSPEAPHPMEILPPAAIASDRCSPLGFSDLAAAGLGLSSDTRSPAKTLRISRRRSPPIFAPMPVPDAALRHDVSTREVLLIYPLGQERD